ncbi:hypothetical protein BGZ60DRAFT_425669 [Tricladium varicosporioides]|nr:hypothetical protein BGZ60DRAFT_425669 [Hymenoscyphus varicosporioides]
MNWTGGRLQRHSGSAGALKNKQQQHFARFKANLLNERKSSPTKRSLLGRGQDSAAENRLQTPTLNSTSRRQRSYNDTRRNPGHRQVDLDLQASRLENAHRRSESQRCDSTALAKYERIPDLYSVTPPPRSAKRERLVSISDDDGVQSENEEALSRKRRKILRKGDWVSVGFQQPPRLTFTSPRRADKVGRRRYITDQERAQYVGKIQAKTASPFVTRHIAANGKNYDTLRLEKADVRISIGGKVVPPGASSSSTHSKSLSLSLSRPISNSVPSQSSDVMLLDNEGPFPALVAHSGLHNQRRFGSTRNIDNILNANFWEQSNPEIRRVLSNKNSQATCTEAYATPNQQPFPGEIASYQIVENGQLSSQSNVDTRNTLHQPIFSSSSASILHPKPQSSKISPLLRTNNSEIADSTVAQVGVTKPVVPSSQAMDNEIWKTWMKAIYSENSLGSPININQHPDDEAFPISPGISAALGVGAPAADKGAPALPNDNSPIDSSGLSRDYEEVNVRIPTYLKVSASADTSIEAEASTSARQPEASMLEFIEQKSRLSASRFLSLSPLGVSNFRHSSGVPDENVKKNKLVTESSQSSSQSEDFTAKVPTAELKATISASVQQKSVESEDPDEIWRKFVFGSEGEEVDVLQNTRPLLCGVSNIRGLSGHLPVTRPMWDALPANHTLQRYKDPSEFPTTAQHSNIPFSTRLSMPFSFGNANNV